MTRRRAGRDFFTACPPNCWRSAATAFIAGDSACREENRANSAAEMTGSGTACAMASSIVQRPSPESSTQPSSWSRRGSSLSASTSRSSSQERTTVPRDHAWITPGTSVISSLASISSKPSA